LANGMMLGSKLPTASTTDGFQNAWVVSWVAPVHEHRTFPRVADKLTIKISQRGIGILQCEVCFWILTPDPPEQCRFGILSKDPPVQRQNCPDPPVWKFTPQVQPTQYTMAFALLTLLALLFQSFAPGLAAGGAPPDHVSDPQNASTDCASRFAKHTVLGVGGRPRQPATTLSGLAPPTEDRVRPPPKRGTSNTNHKNQSKATKRHDMPQHPLQTPLHPTTAPAPLHHRCNPLKQQAPSTPTSQLLGHCARCEMALSAQERRTSPRRTTRTPFFSNNPERNESLPPESRVSSTAYSRCHALPEHNDNEIKHTPFRPQLPTSHPASTHGRNAARPRDTPASNTSSAAQGSRLSATSNINVARAQKLKYSPAKKFGYAHAGRWHLPQRDHPAISRTIITPAPLTALPRRRTSDQICTSNTASVTLHPSERARMQPPTRPRRRTVAAAQPTNELGKMDRCKAPPAVSWAKCSLPWPWQQPTILGARLR